MFKLNHIIIIKNVINKPELIYRIVEGYFLLKSLLFPSFPISILETHYFYIYTDIFID